MEVSKNIHLVPGIVANPYVVVDDTGLTLIDAGLPSNAPKILRFIQTLGVQSTDIKRILITHSDLDHVGSLEALRQSSGGRSAASVVEAEAIRNGKPSRQIQRSGLVSKVLMNLLGMLYQQKPAQIDDLLQAGDELPILGGMQVLSTPGHTPGHISFWLPAQRVLFSGDSIIIRRGQFSPSSGANNWDEAQSEASYQSQMALEPAVILGGHGWARL